MASIFETATRAALEEILQDRLHDSKHGYVLTKDGYQQIIDGLYEFFKASRNLKEVGDRLMSGGLVRGEASRNREK